MIYEKRLDDVPDNVYMRDLYGRDRNKCNVEAFDMEDKMFEYEIINVDDSDPKTWFESFNELFENNPQNHKKKAVIVKWGDCEGKLIIPSQIDDQTIVFGISHSAFELSEKTESIEIPKTVRRIDEDAFNIDRLPAGHCPIIRINYEYGKQSVADSLKNSGWRCINSSWCYSDLIPEKCLVHFEKDGVSFKYRRINSCEIEIVNWISPEDCIKIPRQIEQGLTIVSVGKSAFSGNPNLARVVVPETVRSIEDNAFHYLNRAEYIYGDLYDLGWSESGAYPKDCLIELPADLRNIKGNAFLRGTENTDRRHRRESFTNRLVIVVPKNSTTFDTLIGLGWYPEIETNDFVIFFLGEDSSATQGWLFNNLFIQRKVVNNWIKRTTYEDYIS